MWVPQTEASTGAELTDCLDNERNVDRVHGGVVCALELSLLRSEVVNQVDDPLLFCQVIVKKPGEDRVGGFGRLNR